MNEIDLSQAVKEALQNLVQELSQSYSLPAYLKPLLDASNTESQHATVVFKLFKGKIQLTAPEPPQFIPTDLISDDIVINPHYFIHKKEEVEQFDTSTTPTEQTETSQDKPKRKPRKSEV